MSKGRVKPNEIPRKYKALFFILFIFKWATQNKNQYFKNIIHTKSPQALFSTRPDIGQSFPEHFKTKQEKAHIATNYKQSHST